MEQNKIKSICIVGGGTAGMVAALILRKRFDDNIKIDIIKSEKIGIIGVGEGSTEHWKDFLEYVGISYKEIIKECDATCKSGIMFEGWSEKNFLRDISELTNSKFSQTFVGYLNVICSNNKNKSLISNLHALKNKISSSYINNEKEPTFPLHFNTFKLNSFLEKKAVLRGIKIINDEINKVILNDKKYIKKLIGEKKEHIYDFYIDCTGFRKILISNLNPKWISLSEYLHVNEAIVFPTEDTKEYNLYTSAIAMKYGWMFKIPTYGRWGNGYIFDNDYINSEQAEQEINKKFNKKIKIAKNIKFDPGYLENVWINNCVAIGLSGNFVEPLEASSIGTSIQQSFLLMHYLYGYDENQIASYNEKIRGILENIRDFICLHYITEKKDTPFWIKARSNIPQTLLNNLKKWQTRLPIQEDFDIYRTHYILFREPHFINVLHGLNLLNLKNLKQNLKSLNGEFLKNLDKSIKEYYKYSNKELSNCIGHKEYLDIIRKQNNDSYTKS